MYGECDATIQIDHIVDWIKDYFVRNGKPETKAVIGISGGKDSTIAAALLVRALGADRVIGVLMPNGEQADIEDSYRVCDALGIKHYVVNVGGITSALYEAVDAANDNYNKMNQLLPDNFSCANYGVVSTNAPARARMMTLYAIAGMVGGRVCNTGNRSEIYVGYTTKYGDFAGDFALLSNYTVREVLKIGDLLTEIPYDLIYKAPADGMSGKTDEEKLGFTYEQVDAYLLEETVPDYDTLRRIKEAHERNRHKKGNINLDAPRVYLGKEHEFAF